MCFDVMQNDFKHWRVNQMLFLETRLEFKGCPRVAFLCSIHDLVTLFINYDLIYLSNLRSNHHTHILSRR